MLIPKKGEIRKPSRSASGIVPVAVMLPPRKCKHGNCTYCPSLNVPQSYTPKSPVVMRASQVDYDSYEQVKGRIKAFKIMNHPTDKVELIIMGGTFLEYPKKFQYEFVKSCYDGLNEKISVDLEEAKKINEKAKHRCVALCIETRPDVCVKYIDRLLEFGCTRVELGVQIIDDEIYKKVKRGHLVKDVVETTEVLKNAGFKVGYHVMPGLPGSDVKKDLNLFKKLFSDERFKPDQLKIYPCQVMPGSELEKVYWKGKYKPYSKEVLEKLIAKMLEVVPRYCRVMRIMREIPPEYLVAGTKRIDLRKEVEAELRRKYTQGCTPKNIQKNIFTKGIEEIRFREVGFANKDGLNQDLNLKITKYVASEGEEYFLEIVNKDDILFGLLRLRIIEGVKASPPAHPKLSSQGSDIKNKLIENLLINSKKSRANGNEQGKSAIIRELHVYGQALKLKEKGHGTQHIGLGKQLMAKSEEIVRKEGIKKLSVISGVGVREYYKKLGYELEGDYMIKDL